jgi:hypothetical protein
MGGAELNNRLGLGIEVAMIIVYLIAVFLMSSLSAAVAVGLYRLFTEWLELTPTQSIFAWAGSITALMALRYPYIRSEVEKRRS